MVLATSKVSRRSDDLRCAHQQALLTRNLLDEEMQERLRQMQMDGTLDELIEQLIESHGAGGLHQRRSAPRPFAAVECWRPGRRRPSRPDSKSPTKASTPRLQDLARPDGIAGKIQLRTRTTPRDLCLDRHRGQRRIQALLSPATRSTSTSPLHTLQRHPTRRPEAAAEHRVFRLAGAPVRDTSLPAATVLMLDCSHSMILYGEDRFTPRRRSPWHSRT